MYSSLRIVWFLNVWFIISGQAAATEVIELTEANWDDYAPAGKEVDCIYGDHVMRSDRVRADGDFKFGHDKEMSLTTFKRTSDPFSNISF